MAIYWLQGISINGTFLLIWYYSRDTSMAVSHQCSLRASDLWNEQEKSLNIFPYPPCCLHLCKLHPLPMRYSPCLYPKHKSSVSTRQLTSLQSLPGLSHDSLFRFCCWLPHLLPSIVFQVWFGEQKPSVWAWLWSWQLQVRH